MQKVWTPLATVFVQKKFLKKFWWGFRHIWVTPWKEFLISWKKWRFEIFRTSLLSRASDPCPIPHGGRSWPYMSHGIYCHMCCDWEKQLETYWQFSLKTFLGLHHIIFLFHYWKFEKILKSNTLVHNFFHIFHISKQFSSIGGWEVRTPDFGSGSISHRT